MNWPIKTLLASLSFVFGITTGWSQSITVTLPTFGMDTSVPISTIYTRPITVTQISPSVDGGGNCTDNSTCYIGFQGDVVFDSAVAVPSPFGSSVQGAGLTASGWTVGSQILNTGPGTLKTLRVSAFVNDGVTPLSGSGVLYNTRWVRVSNTVGQSSPLPWSPFPNDFEFIDTDLNAFSPLQTNGLITITGATPSPTPLPPCAPVTQGFDDVATLPGSGWVQINHSQPGPGITNWFQGVTAAFLSHSGATNSYLAANYDNGSGTSTISNWLETPPIVLDNGGRVTFWTRTVSNPAYADRLQVRMSTNGASSTVGSAATDVGDFATLLLDINPTYTLTDYPNVWTQFTATINGLLTPKIGRLAFRYFVENGGPAGTRSDFIGIDTVQYSCAMPTPTPAPVAATVSLPVGTVDTSITNFTKPVVVSTLNAADDLIGFQGDFTFDETVVTFPSSPVASAGLTASNWNVSGNVLPGGGPIRTLRVSAYTQDGITPLSGSGTLYNLNMVRVTTTPGVVTALTWKPTPNDFLFIDTDLFSRAPSVSLPGSITIQAAINISGTIFYCSNPVPGPVPNATLSLTGSVSGSTLSNSSGNYGFSISPGGSYVVTPGKTALLSGALGINTVDVIAAQRHYTSCAVHPERCLSGCALTAGDVNGDGNVTTIDVIAIQRFSLGFTTSIANVGKYKFNPASRVYTGIVSSQTGQNYDTLIFGDVASHFAE